MEKITVRFHKVTKYTDPTGMFRIKVELGMMGANLMGKITTECDNFPTVVSVLGPLDPKKISEAEISLREEEAEGKIKNLTFEEEITAIGVQIKVTPEQVRMN